MIGIVLLNYQKWGETVQCITSIRKNRPKSEEYMIYVVDNASPNKQTVEFIKIKNDKDIFFIQSSSNKGYAAGNNLGIRQAILDNCDYIIVSNSDIYFQENSIDEIAFFLKNKKGICFPKIYNLDGDISNISKKYIEKMYEMYFFCTPLKKYISNKNLINLNGEKNVKTHLNMGPCFALDIENAKKIGHLDENTTLYFEEMILSRKADENDVSIYYCPRSVVIHGEGKSTESVGAFALMCFDESAIYYCRRYLKANILKIYPLYLYFIFRYWIKSIRNIKFKLNKAEHKNRLKKMMKGNYKLT